MEIMVDIETLSTRKDAAIVSIAAVAFDFNKGVIGEFNVDLDVTDSIQTGGHVCGETLKWISQKESIDLADFLKGSVTVSEGLIGFVDWIMAFDTFTVWANGPSFDLNIIRNTALRLNINLPWQYYHERDYRTFVSQAEILGFNRKYRHNDISHNALEDATNQAYIVIDAFNYMYELKRKADDRDLMYLESNLKCSNCSVQIFDEPWHHSNASNKHIHLCDTCNQQLIENKINLAKLGV